MSPPMPTPSASPLSPQQLADLQFKQYKLYVATAENVSDRRAAINRFYVTIHTSLVTALAIVGGYGLFAANGQQSSTASAFLSQIQAPVVVIVGGLGIALCLVWRNNIAAFKKLNTAKYDVILAMEQSLPFHAFGDEWERLKKLKYTQLTRVESLVPWLSLVLYFALLATYFAVVWHVAALIHFG